MNPIEPGITSLIKDFVVQGVSRVSEMQRHIKIFIHAEYPGESNLDRRFNPSNVDVRNHIYM